MRKIKYVIASLILCLSASIAGVLTLDNISASAEEQSDKRSLTSIVRKS